MEFKHLKDNYVPSYPIGVYYETAYDYIINVAEVINDTFKDTEETLILVVRGSSGCILGGGIAYLLTRRGRRVSIAVSRKPNENCHGQSLDGIECNGPSRIIVIDDFIEYGDTIRAIIKELKSVIKTNKFDMLCVANRFSESKTTNKGEDMFKILKCFNYICCNRP